AGDVGTLGQCPGGADTPTPTSTAESPPTPTATTGITPPTPTSTPGVTPATPTSTSELPPATPTSTAAATPTATLPAFHLCVGDCNGDGIVGIEELIRGVNIALGNLPVTDCPALDCEGNGVTINCLIRAVNNALNGCPATPTPTETTEAVPTRTPGGPLG